MPRTAKPAAIKPAAMTSRPAAPGKRPAGSAGSQGRLSGRYALARGPLGIVLAGLILIETIMGLVVRSEHPPANASFVLYAMVVLAFLTLGAFFIAMIWFTPRLYPPSEFPDKNLWLTAVRGEDLVPSQSLPIRSIVHTDPPKEVGAIAVDAVTALATPEGPITGKEAEPWGFNYVTAELQGGGVTSTVIMGLSQHLQSSSEWDYLTVNVGEGNTWLLSRLFIFVSLYRALRNLPSIVFVQSEGGIEKLLGIADPVRVCSVLASQYPWFNEVFAAVLTARKIPIFMSGAIDEWPQSTS